MRSVNVPGTKAARGATTALGTPECEQWHQDSSAYENEGEREHIGTEHPDYRKLHGRRIIIHISRVRNPSLQNSEELGPGSRGFNCRSWNSASGRSDSQSWFSRDRFTPCGNKTNKLRSRTEQCLYRRVIIILVKWETSPVRGRGGIQAAKPTVHLGRRCANLGQTWTL